MSVPVFVPDYECAASAIFHALGESYAEDVNDALHVFYARPDLWGCDDEDTRHGIYELMKAFDRLGLNHIREELDVLHGGCLEV